MARTKIEIEHGNDGSPGYNMWASKETPTLMVLKYLREFAWLQVFQSASIEGTILMKDTRTCWLQGRLTRTYHVCYRPFRTIKIATQDYQSMERQTNTSDPL